MAAISLWAEENLLSGRLRKPEFPTNSFIFQIDRNTSIIGSIEWIYGKASKFENSKETVNA